MSKYGVLSDAHANYPALQAVVDELESEVDGYIYLGDIVGLMGFPSETVSLLRERCSYVICGNHDIKVVRDNTGWVNDPELSEFERSFTHSELSEEQKEWILSLEPLEFHRDVGLVLSHGVPIPEKAHGIREKGLDKRDFVTYASKYSDMDFILVGHTHTQEALDCSSFGHSVVVLNPGTVGQNEDSGIAEYAVIDTDDMSYRLESVEYDIDSVRDRLREVGVPKVWF